MTNLVKKAVIAGLMLGVAIQPAVAQQRNAAPASQSGPVVPGLAVANLDAVIVNSAAYKTAQTQRPVTYKAQIDQAEARRTAISGQLRPLVEKFNRDRQANAAQASLQTQAEAIQRIEQTGQQELQNILAPVALSEAYVNEQISDKLDQAVKNAMQKRQVSILLNPQAVTALNNNAYNLNQAILDELNTLIPSAQLVPPQGWEPREVREARAQQQAQQGGQQPAAPARPAQPAGPQAEGR